MADRFSYSCRRDHINSHTSSFSSTLLEEIYRSIDTVGDDVGDSMRKTRDDAATRFLFKSDEQLANYQRACMIERWMDKKAVARGRSTPDLQQEKMSAKDRQCSSSSSSDSSSGGRGGGSFSSFEVESLPVHPPKPARTGKLGVENNKKEINGENTGISRCNWQGFNDGLEQKPKRESKFVKTKSKAMKLYDDLKKVKQPMSPGGKVAAFLNSLFTAGNVKKSKISAAACGDDSPSLKSTAITCASASSFSRSCLSRTTAKSAAPAANRSVRFFPASVILDEDCRRKSIRRINHGNADVDLILTAIDEELAMHVKKKKDEIGIYEFEHSFDILSKIDDRNRGFDGEFEEEDDEFDGASCASSDLFELENLSAIGMEELPVYETTHLQKFLQMY